MIRDTGKMEVLAPAGSMDAFIGAVNAGADAVYLGGEKYGARAFAANFGTDELVRALHTAHLMGRRIYLTVNTLTRENELAELGAFLAPFAEASLDGVIVQDMGVLQYIRRHFPKVGIHASTQMSVTGRREVRLLKEMGCTRVVPARELSLEEIRDLAAEGTEIECFAHGAMCYAYSGRCLFSSFLGGRSGNRGRCAGTCRLPFEILDGSRNGVRGAYDHPLSMKDLCVLGILPELMDAGVTSLKIEGRMKKPEYAAGVSAIYRKYVDRLYEWDRQGRSTPWQVEEEDLQALYRLYIRSSVSEGYYRRRNGRGMITPGTPGYLGSDEAYLAGIREKYLGRPASVPVDCTLAVFRDRPVRLTVPGELEMEGAVAESARTAAANPENIRRKLCQRGEEAQLVFENVTIQTDGASFIPVSAVKDLRRKALTMLEKQRLAAYAAGQRAAEAPPAVSPGSAPDRPKEYSAAGQLLLRVSGLQQLEACLQFASAEMTGNGGCALLLEPWLLDRETLRQWKETGIFAGRKVYIAFPAVYRESQESWIRLALDGLMDGLFTGAAAACMDTLVRLRDEGYDGEIILDHSLYIWNTEARDLYLHTAGACIAGYELSFRELAKLWPEELGRRLIVPVYGRAPLMISAGCIRKTAGKCMHSGYGVMYLKDRMKECFPVLMSCGEDGALCQNTVWNSVPTSLHRMLDDAPASYAASLMLSFTDESAEETVQILRYFRDLLRSRRLQEADPPYRTFTNGHARKGAE